MRRLTAIMFLDISSTGGTKTKSDNQPDGLNRKLSSLISRHSGELIKKSESGHVVSFENAVDAISCATKIRERLEEDSELQAHIGIHIGDLHSEDEEVFGSGVEGASQICRQAPAGGVYISRRIYDSQRFQQALRDQAGLHSERIVEIDSEIDEKLTPVYKVLFGGSSSSALKDVAPQSKGYSSASAMVAGAVLILSLGLGIWWLMPNESTTTSQPSVAVLPFEDFSQEGNQEWYSDGLTEEILNSLMRLDELYVPARTSSFAFKNKNIPIQQIADSLNVNHVVEGSVRRSEGNVRISVQLIEAKSGGHLWSKTYDRPTDSVFAVQKDIAEQITNTLNVYLDEKKREQMFAFGTQDVKAYEAFLKGDQIYYTAHQGGSISELWEANKWYNKAIKLDSTFAFAYQQRTDAYNHFLVDQLSAQNNSLSDEDAHKRIISDFDRSIRHSNIPTNQLFYRFSKSFYTDNWEQIPDLAWKIKDNPDAYQSFVLTGGAVAPTGFIGVGYPSLARELYRAKLKQDPLNGLFKNYDIWALLALDKAGEALKTYPEFLEKNPRIKIKTFIFDGELEKAKSLLTRIETEDNADRLIGYKLLLGMEKMSKQELISYLEEKNSLGIKKVVSFAAGYPEMASRFASRIDTMLTGCKKLTPVTLGNILIFDLKATPNLARCLEQAQIETEPYTLAGRKVRRIVPKEL